MVMRISHNLRLKSIPPRSYFSFELLGGALERVQEGGSDIPRLDSCVNRNFLFFFRSAARREERLNQLGIVTASEPAAALRRPDSHVAVC